VLVKCADEDSAYERVMVGFTPVYTYDAEHLQRAKECPMWLGHFERFVARGP